VTGPAGQAPLLTGLSSGQREQAMARFAVLRPHLEDGVPLARAAGEAGVAARTAQRWLARYRACGLAGLARTARADTGRRRVPAELAGLIEGLALRKPRPTVAASLDDLDLLLVMVAKPRMVHRDGIHFQGLRYLAPALAAYIREPVTIRYDPRDITEIRVFHRNRFLCRAISPEHPGETITLKDIQAARAAHRRALRGQINERITRITDFLPGPAPDQAPQLPSPVPRRATPRLGTYLEDTR